MCVPFFQGRRHVASTGADLELRSFRETFLYSFELFMW